MNPFANLIRQANRTSLATFGVPVVYTPSVDSRPEFGGQPIQLLGIFDAKRQTDPMMGGFSNGGVEIGFTHSAVEIMVSDLGINPMTGDGVLINGMTYQVLDVQPDGKGMAVLVIDQVPDPFSI